MSRWKLEETGQEMGEKGFRMVEEKGWKIIQKKV